MYDLIVIGAGPAGYVAAERAGEMGKSVLIIEKDQLGGVCLNTGCIPTKSMLFSAKLYSQALHAEVFGVGIENASFDYRAVRARTEALQADLRKGVAGLMKHAGATVVDGEATITAPGKVEVGGEVYEATNILIATGSKPFIPPIDGLIGNEKVVTNIGILCRETMVDHLCVIGGGVIGCEFADLYAMAGKKVTVIEMLPQICGNVDSELALTLQKKLKSKGVDIHVNATVTRVDDGSVHFRDKKNDNQTIEADLILVATGRAAAVEGIGLEAVGVDVVRRVIKVNEKAETNLPGIYAAGDVTGKMQLAHFAYRQGTVAVNNMFGLPDICREDAIPAVVYTDPEIASVGLTEDMARERGMDVKSAKMPLSRNGRYLAETHKERGIIKIVTGARNGEIIGVHMIGPHASEMIGAAVVMIETELCVSDIKELVFPHPTISEALRDVAFLIND